MPRKYLILSLSIAIILSLIVISNLSNQDPMTYTYNPQAWEKVQTENDYYQYVNEKLLAGASDATIDQPIVIPAYDFVDTTFPMGDVIDEPGEKVNDFLIGHLLHKSVNENFSLAKQDYLLYMPESGAVTWKFHVPQTGFYQLKIRYYPIEGKSSAIERALAINGEIPFERAKNFVFPRLWGNSQDSFDITETNQIIFKKDLNGNDVKPQQIEIPHFLVATFRDNLGYVTEPYRFYFDASESQTLTLTSIKENMLIDEFYICKVEQIPSYQEYKASLDAKRTITTPSTMVRIEAEGASSKSSPTLYPITDRSSANTTPYSPYQTKLNAIGGNNWKVLGDQISWEFEIPQDGFYLISLRARQNLVRGLYSNRIVYLDREVVFNELNTTLFAYSSSWQNFTLGSKDEAFEFYLTKGRHTLTLEVTLGEYSTLIERIEAVIDDLNQLYRDIIKFTSPAPDPNRDYQLTEREGLDMIPRMRSAKEELEAISKAIETISGTKSDKTGVIDTAVVQLNDFVKNPREVPARLKTFVNNISALGTLLGTLREYPLTIDYIMIHTPDIELPKANEGLLKKLWKAIQSFWYSFFIDYSAISSTEAFDFNTSIDVWMTFGRDQANVIRNLIDESFTPKTGIKVNLKLTGSDVLLKATLAGIGPHVAINVDSTLPVNYGLRQAVLDLREFPDYEVVIERNAKLSDAEFYALPKAEQEWRFKMSALKKFEFNGAVYALPEKEVFLMMFVRHDVLSELGLIDKIPTTWDEVISIVAELQANQLQFYLPVNEVGASSLNPLFISILYQMGGELYIDEAKRTGLMDDVALDAFKYWTEFYTLYSLPTSANFLNRFRSGEMPIGIAFYELYNTLSVFAPDLRGKWSFYPIPGMRIDEHTIDHTSPAIGTGSVILKQPALKDPEAKLASWEFIKWWTSATTQVRFGREMEGILGSAARHACANTVALEQLAWPTSDYIQLSKQWEMVKEIPNVAGSYITGREVENAYRKVINELVNAKETLYEYAQNIQNEIDRKRLEFGLALASGK